MTRMTLSVLALIVLPALACSSPMQGRDASARVTLTTDRATYSPGETVNITLKNGADGAVGYNLCTRILERRASVSWEQVQRFPEAPNVCTMNLLNLSAGESARVEAIIPASATAGRYRLTFPGSPPEARTTNEFAVELVEQL